MLFLFSAHNYILDEIKEKKTKCCVSNLNEVLYNTKKQCNGMRGYPLNVTTTFHFSNRNDY